MTEHEKFIEICDLIEYKIPSHFHIMYSYIRCIHSDNHIDVREIIFTQEFMNKLIDYDNYMSLELIDEIRRDILFHLNDPVQYLYNTLWLWNQ